MPRKIRDPCRDSSAPEYADNASICVQTASYEWIARADILCCRQV